MKTVLIIDGQGGRIGRSLAEKLLSKNCPCRLLAVGTNSMATAAMLKAGIQDAATGENPVCVCADEADIITGPLGILAANSLMGEITPRMAAAVSESKAVKILVPVTRCRVRVAGVSELPVTAYIDQATETIYNLCAEDFPSRTCTL